MLFWLHLKKYSINFDFTLLFFLGQDRPLVEDGVEAKYFIEAGAYDGAFLSNSLFLELKHKWSGLLVEPNPDYFKMMELRGRRAWLYPGCFSTKDKPEIVQFDAAGLVGGIEVQTAVITHLNSYSFIAEAN